MNETKQKALTIANTLLGTDRVFLGQLSHQELMMTLVHVVEQSEAFKQEVSDAVEAYVTQYDASDWSRLKSFIIPKPDPLVEIMEAYGWYGSPTAADNLRAALEARGLEIREKGQ
jgi:hypothetical protein